MYQQINMYQPVFRRQPKIFSAATLLKIVALAAVLLLSVYMHARWTLQGLQRTSAELTQNYRQLDARLIELEAFDKTPANNAAGNEIIVLQKQISERRELLQHIDQLSINTTAGFAEVFETLARQEVPGLWLTGIRLDHSGNTEIRGTTLDPKLVPRYLQLMARQPRLAALNNGTVNLTRQVPEQAEIDFVLTYNTQEGAH